ncbi:DUF4097 family beta strand repeat-containing protein [Pseudobutyrivibrio xylanivorans]|uniref:Putative adhesin n=1 Tax=Pseudobutyrivibrio xylanivorans TaxID=185007 RepID=A0A1G5RRL5_PSEXY|nr:DUF4097 family beta strand repeat-containing protein [Pseudobutyrivibrio xylanivorans]SCZ76498.1 Putative adhesin [Pseudobutyrivibrio xylanivorans]
MENKKWTKKYLVIIWLVTLIIVVAAMWGHIMNFGGFSWFSDGWHNGNSETRNYDFSNEKVTDIVIDMSAADINIKYGSQLSVDSSFPEKYEPTVELKGGKLTIVQKDSAKHKRNLDGYKLDIVVPNNTKLDSLKIDIAAGDIDIKDIQADDFDIDANAGDIDINDITAEKIDIDANAGDIDVKNVTAEKIGIDANAGDLNLMDSTAKSAEVSANAGDIDITGTYDQIECACDFGDVDIDAPSTERKNIDVDCAFGSVNVNSK